MADLLRDVLGPPRPSSTSLHVASHAYHRSQRRAMLRRGVVVLIIMGAFLSAASLMSWKQPIPVVHATGMVAEPVSTGSIGVVRRPYENVPAASGGPEYPLEGRRP